MIRPTRPLRRSVPTLSTCSSGSKRTSVAGSSTATASAVGSPHTQSVPVLPPIASASSSHSAAAAPAPQRPASTATDAGRGASTSGAVVVVAAASSPAASLACSSSTFNGGASRPLSGAPAAASLSSSPCGSRPLSGKPPAAPVLSRPSLSPSAVRDAAAARAAHDLAVAQQTVTFSSAEGTARNIPDLDPARRGWRSTAITLDTRRPPSYVLFGKLTTQEQEALREEAQAEYRNRMIHFHALELMQAEGRMRDELTATALDTLRAVQAWAEEVAAGDGRESEKERAHRRLQARIQRRIAEEARALSEHEARLRDAGREAWRLEVEEQAARAEESKRLEQQRREAEAQFRAAVTFVVCQERREREAAAAAEDAAFAALLADFEADRRAAEALAHERFMSSPEQVALLEAQQKKEAKARRLAAKAARKFALEQQRFITSCRHAANGGSLFEGPAPRKICGRCRVRFDDDLGYYVSMDDTPKGSAGQQRSRSRTSASLSAVTGKQQRAASRVASGGAAANGDRDKEKGKEKTARTASCAKKPKAAGRSAS